jgi:hypothetical protein
MCVCSALAMHWLAIPASAVQSAEFLRDGGGRDARLLRALDPELAAVSLFIGDNLHSGPRPSAPAAGSAREGGGGGGKGSSGTLKMRKQISVQGLARAAVPGPAGAAAGEEAAAAALTEGALLSAAAAGDKKRKRRAGEAGGALQRGGGGGGGGTLQSHPYSVVCAAELNDHLASLVPLPWSPRLGHHPSHYLHEPKAVLTREIVSACQEAIAALALTGQHDL